MNKLYLSLLLLICHSSFSQDSRLFAHDWYLTNVIDNGVSNPPPRNNMGVRFESPTQMYAWACLGMYVTTSFPDNQTGFSGSNFSPCLCWCNDPVAEAYEGFYFNFFWEDDPVESQQYSYVITELGNNERSLVITSMFNKQAIYSSVHMANTEFEKLDFSISPNPSADIIEIKLDNQSEENTQIEFYDNLGKICKTEQSNFAQIKIDTSNLPQGLYFVKIKNGNSTITKKFLKL